MSSIRKSGFCLWLTLTFIEIGSPARPLQTTAPPAPISQHGQIFPKKLYMIQSLGDAIAHDGTTRMQVRKYVDSEGIMASVIHGTFGSWRLSTDELQFVVERASKTVEQGPKRARFGNIVGKRVVLVFTGKVPGHDAAVVAWTAGREFYEVSSSSMPVALDMASRQ